MNIALDSSGFHQLNGQFKDHSPNVARVRLMYSLDNKVYKVISEEYPNDWYYLNLMGTKDEDLQRMLENQYCALSYQEPLKSYRATTIDHFYVRLEITT